MINPIEVKSLIRLLDDPDKEIYELVQTEAQRHRNLITEKLKEIENRKA